MEAHAAIVVLVNALAVLALASVMPVSAVAFLRFRLPRKEQEFSRIVEALRLKEQSAAVFAPNIKNEYSGGDYAFPVSLATAIAALGAVAVFFGNRFWDPKDPSPPIFFKPLCGTDAAACHTDGLLIVVLGFLGAYLWSVQHIVRRLVTVDLPPGAYFGISMRMMYVPFLALALAYLGPVKYLAAIAFLLGFFPEQGLHYLKGQLLVFRSRKERGADPLPLEIIEGINQYHKMRLEEVGIDNVQNLAYANVAELLIRTPFKPKTVVDWIDQAKLCLAFTSDVGTLRAQGVRTCLGFLLIGEEGLLKDLSVATNISEVRLRTVYEQMRQDPGVRQLRQIADCLAEI